MGDAVKLTTTQAAILERTPPDLSGALGGFFHPSDDHRELERRGLLAMDGYGSMGGGFACRYRITPAGLSALTSKEQNNG